jgi:hypothetical protein
MLVVRRRLARDVKSLGLHSTDIQQSTITQRSNALLAKIKSWFFIQQLYCPTASLARARALAARPDDSPTEMTQSIKLFLPSMLGTSLPCDPMLQQYEWQLRYAQAHGTLDVMRSRLRLRSALYKHKDRFVRGQKANTRSRSKIDQVDASIAAAAESYRVARAALAILGPILGKDTMWQDQLRRLNEEDIRALSVGADGDSEGKRTISWIWVVQGVARDVDEDERLHECMPSPSSRINLTHNLQLCVLNGVKVGLEPCAGPKKWTYYGKKCAALWKPWYGRPTSGRLEAQQAWPRLTPQIMQRAFQHMPADSHLYVARWQVNLPDSGQRCPNWLPLTTPRRPIAFEYYL